MGFLDDAIGRAQDIAGELLAPQPPSYTPLGLNPTLAPVNTGTDPQPREPIIRPAQADGMGVATVTLDPVDPGGVWLLDYVVVSSDSAAVSSCQLFDTYPDLGHLLDGAVREGNAGVAWYSPPRRLGPSHQLIARWTGATPGANCTLRVEYRVEATP